MTDEQCKQIANAIEAAALTIATAVLVASGRDLECRPSNESGAAKRLGRALSRESRDVVENGNRQ